MELKVTLTSESECDNFIIKSSYFSTSTHILEFKDIENYDFGLSNSISNIDRLIGDFLGVDRINLNNFTNKIRTKLFGETRTLEKIKLVIKEYEEFVKDDYTFHNKYNETKKFIKFEII